jgi:hypothetical protein
MLKSYSFSFEYESFITDTLQMHRCSQELRFKAAYYQWMDFFDQKTALLQQRSFLSRGQDTKTLKSS